jgi:FixJ family two-component response regulator
MGHIEAEAGIVGPWGRYAMTRHNQTVLLVDDDAAVRDSLKLFLETHGMTVADFASGGEFLASDCSTEDACLVLDVHMPLLDGIDLVNTLSRRGLSPPTVLITGRADRETRSRATAAGIRNLLEKPFDGEALLATINRAIEWRPGL